MFNQDQTSSEIAASAASTTSVSSRLELLKAFDSYEWDEDTQFQTGLNQVLSSLGESVEETPDLILRAKIFFYNRNFGEVIDFEEYKDWKASEHVQTNENTNDHDITENQVSSSTEETPFPRSYASIVELILSGKPVPGIKDIPDTILGEDSSSKSEVNSRKKPWELAEEKVDVKEVEKSDELDEPEILNEQTNRTL